jgi:hypothetical protein
LNLKVESEISQRDIFRHFCPSLIFVKRIKETALRVKVLHSAKLQACKYIITLGREFLAVTNTLAYYTTLGIESFIAQAAGEMRRRK